MVAVGFNPRITTPTNTRVAERRLIPQVVRDESARVMRRSATQ